VTLLRLFNVLAIAWPVSEVILGLRTRAKPASATVRDRGSIVVLWGAIALGLVAGHLIRLSRVGSIGAPWSIVLPAAMVLLVCGLAIRWTAILSLGRSFTPNVAVQPGQRVVRTGVYRHVRHPSYSGLLLAFLGMGVAFNNWLSLLAVLVPVVAGLSYRIRVEENAMVEMLGSEYVDYCKLTKRLIPGIY
jgi:protein-S-isoprenylcysteine O-methyltransferase Ste14